MDKLWAGIAIAGMFIGCGIAVGMAGPSVAPVFAAAAVGTMFVSFAV